MTFKQILQGRFMAHPVHPALVHIPVGLWFGALVFDIISRTADLGVSNFFVVGAYYTVLFGVLAAVPTAITGVAEFVDIPRGTKAHSYALIHLVMNVTLVVGYILQLFIRDITSARVGVGMLVFNLLEFAALGVSGYIGGKLAYEYRIGARSPDRRDQPELRRVA